MRSDAATASAGGLAPVYGASSVANQPASRRWSVRSMPRSSPMTANGSGPA